MGSKKPKVTVMMPVHNAAQYLTASIRSVLDQNFRSFELVIYDDGSSDGSFAIAEKFSRQDSRIRLMRSKVNLGVSRARNAILKAARGRYIAPQDADDLMMQNRLKDLSGFLDAHPAIGVVFGSACWFGGRKNWFFRPWLRTPEGAKEIPRSQVVRSFPWFHHGASLFRRSLALRIGGYDPRLKTSEDMDLFFRLFEKTRFFYRNRLYYMYRYNPKGISTRHWVTVERRRAEFRKSCRREVLRLGPYRVRLFFTEPAAAQFIKNHFAPRGWRRADDEPFLTADPKRITFLLKPTSGAEDGLDLELIAPEIDEMRRKGSHVSIHAFTRTVTIYYLPGWTRKKPRDHVFASHFMEPLRALLSKGGAAGEAGLQINKKAEDPHEIV